MKVTFEDAWHARLPPSDDLPRLLPDIDSARRSDRQVAVYLPATWGTREARHEPPARLDGLASKPWVESVVLGWRAHSSVTLPGIRSLIGLNMFCDADADTLGRLPDLEQLVQHDVLPEHVAAQPHLRDAIFDWSTYDVPAGVDHLRLLNQPAEREQYRRPTAGASALAALRSVERLRISSLHYKEDAAPIGELTNLRWLSLQGWRNLRQVGRLIKLECLELLEFEMANLRAFRELNQLRQLSLMGRMKSLDGIAALGALEDVWFHGAVARDLAPLAELPMLRRLTLLWPGAGTDFTPLSRLSRLSYLELLIGNDSDAGSLPSIQFLASLEQLEEVRLLNVDIADGRLDPLFELPQLRRLHLTGVAGPDLNELRRRRPDLEIESALVGEPAGRVYVGPIHYDQPALGIERWSILQSLADLLGSTTNHDAEKRVRGALRRRDAALLKRLEFDSEAGAVGIYATNEPDIRAAAEAIRDLAAGA